MAKRIKKLVIAAGGKGTRFLPITSVLPKEMFPLIDRPVFQYVLEEGLVNGIDELILAVSRDKRILLDYIKSSKDEGLRKLLRDIKITVVYKKDLIGNAAGILDARRVIGDNPFIIVWADSFGLRRDNRIGKMIDVYKKLQKPIICLLPFFERARYLYAVPELERVSKDLMIVKRIFEKPGRKKIISSYCFGNGYLLEPDIIDFIEESTRNQKGEYVLEEAVDTYSQQNLVYGLVFRKPFFELGNRRDFAKTSLYFLKYRNDLKKDYFQILDELNRERVSKK